MKNVPNLRFQEFSEEWETTRAENIFRSITDKKHDGNLLVLSATQDRGVIPRNETGIDIKYEKENLSSYKRVKYNDYIISLRSFQGGIEHSKYEGLVSPAYTVFNFKDESLFNHDFFAAIFKSQNFINRLNTLTYGIRDGKAISFTDFSSMKLIYPKKKEQEKIAAFFSLIDKKIELQTEKVEELKNYKKGIMQKIFSQELRFKDENGNNYPEWEEKELRKYLIPRVQKQVPSKEAPLMAFTSKGGIESKGEKYDRSFLVKDETKKYKRTEFNDFIYSSNNLDVGSMGLNKYGTAVISDVYEIFQIEKSVLPDIVNVILHKPDVLNKVLKYRQGALYGQYRIHADDFLSVNVKIPCYKEQEKIALFLESIDKSINMHTKKRDLLIDYKKGLLQQMFI